MVSLRTSFRVNERKYRMKDMRTIRQSNLFFFFFFFWKSLGEMILIRGQSICSMMNGPLSFHTILVMMDGL